jgi:hypothetical protein
VYRGNLLGGIAQGRDPYWQGVRKGGAGVPYKGVVLRGLIYEGEFWHRNRLAILIGTYQISLIGLMS